MDFGSLRDILAIHKQLSEPIIGYIIA